MTLLIIGLIMFLGIHSTRIFFEPVRVWWINTFGAGIWRALYTIISFAGLILIVIGFAPASANATVVWVPPFALLHVTAFLTLLSSIFVAAAYLPAGRIKARLRHPMTVGVMVWALAHLLINGMSHEVLLFGSMLIWSVLVLLSALRRDRQMRLAFLAGPVRNDLIAIVIGAAVWVVLVGYAHEWLFGVAPLV